MRSGVLSLTTSAHRKARLAFQPSQQAAQLLACLSPRFAARKEIIKAGAERRKRCSPALQLLQLHQVPPHEECFLVGVSHACPGKRFLCCCEKPVPPSPDFPDVSWPS